MLNTDHTHILMANQPQWAAWQITFFVGIIFNGGEGYCTLSVDGQPGFLNFDNLNDIYPNMEIIKSDEIVWPSFQRKVFEVTCSHAHPGRLAEWKVKTLTITRMNGMHDILCFNLLLHLYYSSFTFIA